MSQPTNTYQAKLANVDATTGTADKILSVISDPRKAVAIVILIFGLLLIIVVFRSKIKSAFTSVWEFLARPFRDVQTQSDVADAVAQLTGETSTGNEITMDQARTAADELEGCIDAFGDNEQGILNVIDRYVHCSYDWELIVQVYGVRKYYKFFVPFSAGLENTLTDNLSSYWLDRIRQLLLSRGVRPEVIHLTK